MAILSPIGLLRSYNLIQGSEWRAPQDPKSALPVAGPHARIPQFPDSRPASNT